MPRSSPQSMGSRSCTRTHVPAGPWGSTSCWGLASVRVRLEEEEERGREGGRVGSGRDGKYPVALPPSLCSLSRERGRPLVIRARGRPLLLPVFTPARSRSLRPLPPPSLFISPAPSPRLPSQGGGEESMRRRPPYKGSQGSPCMSHRPQGRLQIPSPPPPADGRPPPPPPRP